MGMWCRHVYTVSNKCVMNKLLIRTEWKKSMVFSMIFGLSWSRINGIYNIHLYIYIFNLRSLFFKT